MTIGNGYVPSKFMDMTSNNVNIGEVPSGADHQMFVKQYHYLIGRGTQLIPIHALTGTQWQGDAITDEMPIFPRMQDTDRYHLVTAKVASGVGRLNLKVGAQAVKTYYLTEVPQTFFYREANITASVSTTFLALPFSATFPDGDGILMQYGCFGAPRTYISDLSTDKGIWDDTNRTNAPIFGDETASPTRSIKAIANAVSGALQEVRRPGILLLNSSPIKENGLLISASVNDSAANAGATHYSTLSAAISMPRRHFSEITGTADFAVCIHGTAVLTTGTLRLSTNAGVSIVPVRCGTGYTWVTGTVPVQVDAWENNSMLPAGFSTTDTIGLVLQASGSGNAHFHKLLVGEKNKSRL